MVINDYLHCYDFKYSYFLNGYKDIILDHFNNRVNSSSKDVCLDERFDRELKFKPVNDYILPKLEQIVKKYYYAGENFAEGRLSVYVQPPNQSKEEESFYHNHIHVPGNICGVFYLNLPKQGGGFQVWNSPYLDYVLKPQLDKVYLFPTWLMHRALPHKDNINRMCFNWIYNGNIKPIHKLTGIIW